MRKRERVCVYQSVGGFSVGARFVGDLSEDGRLVGRESCILGNRPVEKKNREFRKRTEV